MKKNIYSYITPIVGAFLLLLLPTACSDFTDIQPKGKNLLKSTDDLSLLLNNSMELSMSDLKNVGCSEISANLNVPAALSVSNPSRSAYLIGWKDNYQDLTRLELLTTSDAYYTNSYSVIGTIANPILQQLPSASGTNAVKNELKAEALALRAYFHFMVLQKFAKAYNPSTADTDPAIAYMTEDVDISSLQPKKTVKEAYTLALKDIDDAIALNALPVTNVSTMRMNKAAAFAVKAHISAWQCATILRQRRLLRLPYKRKVNFMIIGLMSLQIKVMEVWLIRHL